MAIVLPMWMVLGVNFPFLMHLRQEEAYTLEKIDPDYGVSLNVGLV